MTANTDRTDAGETNMEKPRGDMEKRSSKMFTLDVTLAGVTKTVVVEGHSYRESGEITRLYVPGAVARIGRGTARYPTEVQLTRITTQSSRSPQTAVDQDGGQWFVSLRTVVRNRQAQIVGWDDECLVTNDSQNHKVEAKRLVKELTEATVAANPEAFLALPIRRCVHQLDGERCEKEALASRKVCAGHYQAPAGDAILKALRTAWRTYLSQVDGGAEHMAIQRASNYASRNHEVQTKEWYATAINYYMDR